MADPPKNYAGIIVLSVLYLSALLLYMKMIGVHSTVIASFCGGVPVCAGYIKLLHRNFSLADRMGCIQVESSQRLSLLRELIDLSYTHDRNHTKFFDKFRDNVELKNLKDKNIIDFSRKDNLSRNDSELQALIDNGFSSRELTVVYGHNNPNSIYIKKHRLYSRTHPEKTKLPNYEKTTNPAGVLASRTSCCPRDNRDTGTHSAAQPDAAYI